MSKANQKKAICSMWHLPATVPAALAKYAVRGFVSLLASQTCPRLMLWSVRASRTYPLPMVQQVEQFVQAKDKS